MSGLVSQLETIAETGKSNLAYWQINLIEFKVSTFGLWMITCKCRKLSEMEIC